MRSVNSLVVDEKELTRFIEWLTPLREDEAYEVILLIRSTGLRDKYGFKGTDHKLDSKVIHGYLNEIINNPPPVFNKPIEHWRLRLYEDVLKLGAEAVNVPWYYIRYVPGTRIVDSVYTVPPELMGVFISINPSNIMKASLSTVKDVVDSAWTIASTSKIKEAFRRPDTRYHANIMRHSKTRFHTIDVDDKELGKRLLELFASKFGFKPATIKTVRGIHILINIELLTSKGVNYAYFGKAMDYRRMIEPLLSRYDVASEKEKEEMRSKLERYVWESNDPLFQRITVASKIYRNERGGPLVEIKKKPIEPVPGTRYKGEVIVTFTPEEF